MVWLTVKHIQGLIFPRGYSARKELSAPDQDLSFKKKVAINLELSSIDILGLLAGRLLCEDVIGEIFIFSCLSETILLANSYQEQLPLLVIW